MLSISELAPGQGDYYATLARAGHFELGAEGPGSWIGTGARSARLTWPFDEKEYLNLIEGRRPDGTPGVQRHEDRPSRLGLNMTFSAPESVNTLWGVVAANLSDTRHAILEAQGRAVERAFEYLEANCAFSRAGSGVVRERVHLLAAEFWHGRTWIDSPNLHSHVVVANVCIRSDGSFGTVLGRPIYEERMTAGALYRAELAAQLGQRLGVVTVRDRSSFGIDGVSRPLTEAFSKPWRATLAAREPGGRAEAVGAEVGVRDASRGKSSISQQVLFEQWYDVAQRHGFTERQVAALCERRVYPGREADPLLAAGATLRAATRQQDHFTRGDLVRFLAQEALGRGLGADDVIATADRVLDESPDIVPLGEWGGKARFTTKEVMECERPIMPHAGPAAADSARAMRVHAERGQVHVADDRLGAMRELIARWGEQAASNPGGNLMITGLPRETWVLNLMAQAERSETGLIEQEAVRVGADAFHAGDRVLFTRNSGMFGLRNGDLGTVVEVRPNQRQVAVRLDGGRVLVVPLADYDHMKLGYAVTAHNGQGVTCENAFVLASGGMQDRHLTCVRASRETRLFIDRLGAGPELTLIARRMEQERFKEMASELLKQNLVVQQQRDHQQVHDR